MKTIEDNTVFEPAARELATRLIQRIASLLHDAPEVPFDVTNADAADSELLFNLCFFAAAAFEEQSGIQVAYEKYTPRVAFDHRDGTADGNISIGSAQVHGFVDDEQILEAIKRARITL